MVTYSIIVSKGIKCLDCGLVSFNVNDIEHKYCGNCHEFHSTKEFRKLSTHKI